MKMLRRHKDFISKDKTEQFDLSEWGLHRYMIIFKNASSGQVWGEEEKLVKAKLNILILFPCQH